MVEVKVEVESQILAPSNKTRDRKRRRGGCYCCLMCCLGTLILLAILIVILIFTVFKVKDPNMILNKISLKSGKTGGPVIQPGSNITMIADSTVTNSNVGTFKFTNTTSSIFYKGIMVAQGYGPPGQVKSHGSFRMNTTVEIITTRLLTAPNLTNDLILGVFTMDSYTRAPGKVTVLFVKKNVVVEMNCTVDFNITSQEIQDQKCKSHVDF